MAAPPVDSPCDGPVTYPGDIKILIKPQKKKRTDTQYDKKAKSEGIKQYQEKWLQHVQRMDTNRLSKQALKYKPKGRRNVGRPRKRWSDQLHLEDQGKGNTPKPS